ncbi:hypothetical protein ZTR_00212 [Talaromyces verruculosus]|nr:hypothetical protein ZTR_00212 [Talaromyces verruculosus]
MSHSEPCVYGEDKRQVASRVTKERISSLASSMEHIEEILSRLDSRTVRFQDRASDSAPPIASGTGSNSAHTSPSPDLLHHGDDLVRTGSPSVRSVPHISDIPNATARVQARHQQEPLSPNAVTYIVKDRDSVSAHGASSVFHYRDVNSHQSQSSVTIPSQKAYNHNTEHYKMQLVANAALQRQIEAHKFLTPTNPFEGVDWDTIRHLLDIHWNRHHLMFLLTYRPLVVQNFHEDGPYANQLLWYAIFYASALHSQRREIRGPSSIGPGLKDMFYHRFKTLLPNALEKSSVPSVAALLLMGSSLVSSGQQTAGWMYCGLAYRMINDLGLDLDMADSLSPHSTSQSTLEQVSLYEQEMRRRIFWSAYMIDKFQSLYFGRLPALNLTGHEPSQIFLDIYEDMDLWTPYNDPQVPIKEQPSYHPLPTYVVATFGALLQLAEISADIIQSFYHPSAPSTSPADAISSIGRIQSRLQKWQNDLPQHLRFNPESDLTLPPHQITCLTTFHVLNILLHRPFLHEGHLSHFNMNDDSSRGVCASSASNIYHISQRYGRSFGFQHAPYLFSYALFSAATVIPKESCEAGFSSFVLGALTAIQEGANGGLLKPIMIIRDLLARTGMPVEVASSINNMGMPRPSSNSVQPPDELSSTLDPFTGLENPGPDAELGADLRTPFRDTWNWDQEIPTLSGSDLLFGLIQ